MPSGRCPCAAHQLRTASWAAPTSPKGPRWTVMAAVPDGRADALERRLDVFRASQDAHDRAVGDLTGQPERLRAQHAGEDRDLFRDRVGQLNRVRGELLALHVDHPAAE